jgi:ubiquinone/menaquinone biosynthesis C-methylase UbiE
MSQQKSLFLQGEADAWFARNKEALSARDPQKDAVLKVISALHLAPKNALEVGCADGWRLRGLEALTGARCSGVEPSAQAVSAGLALAPHHTLKTGTADSLDFPDAAFDLVVYGFCLTYCDPKDLFKVAQEGDRVLADGGMLVIYDFCTDIPYRNVYAHRPGAYCYKMRYADLFSWSPVYSVVHHELVSHQHVVQGKASSVPDSMDERIGITVLRKSVVDAFIDNPFK